MDLVRCSWPLAGIETDRGTDSRTRVYRSSPRGTGMSPQIPFAKGLNVEKRETRGSPARRQESSPRPTAPSLKRPFSPIQQNSTPLDCQCCSVSLGRISVPQSASPSRKGLQFQVFCLSCSGDGTVKRGPGRPRKTVPPTIEILIQKQSGGVVICHGCGKDVGACSLLLGPSSGSSVEESLKRGMACTRCAPRYRLCTACHYHGSAGVFHPLALFSSDSTECQLPHQSSFSTIFPTKADYKVFDVSNGLTNSNIPNALYSQAQSLYETHLVSLNTLPEFLDRPGCPFTHVSEIQASASQNTQRLFSKLSSALSDKHYRMLCLVLAPESNEKKTRTVIGFSILEWELPFGTATLQTLVLPFHSHSSIYLSLICHPLKALQEIQERLQFTAIKNAGGFASSLHSQPDQKQENSKQNPKQENQKQMIPTWMYVQSPPRIGILQSRLWSDVNGVTLFTGFEKDLKDLAFVRLSRHFAGTQGAALPIISSPRTMRGKKESKDVFGVRNWAVEVETLESQWNKYLLHE